MNAQWNLDKLYKGFDDPKFVSDEAKLDLLIQENVELSQRLEGDPLEILKKVVTLLLSIQSLTDSLFNYPSLRQSANTSDAESTAVMGRLSQKCSALSAPFARFVQYVARIPNLDELIEQDALLKEHKFYLSQIREQEKYVLSPEVENVISLYSISGSSAWSDLQSYLTSTVPVEYRGETTNLSDIRNKAYDADAQTRKSAYEAEIKAYDRIKDSIAYSLNSIKMEVIQRCHLRGYDSPLDETLKSAKMKRETLDALLGAMQEYLPKFWEYLRAKAKLLGHENGLPWYDMFAPLKGSERQFTPEECRDYLVNLFSGFDQEEANLIQTAFDQEWIDFFPRDGKVGGAFCASAHTIGESRVLTNYGGALSDVVTLAHELGHAFHNYCLKENTILNTEVSMPMAETASTFNEVVAMNAAITAEKDPIARRALIENQLMDATQIICDIYSRYLFESAVFERREGEFMFADKLCEMMLDAQKKAYGNGLDSEILHPYMWACKSHYYSGGLSFYNFPYAFGGLFARGLYAKYLSEGEAFVPQYKRLLKATGVSTVEEAALIANIDLTKPDFWRSSLQLLADEIDEFISLCNL